MALEKGARFMAIRFTISGIQFEADTVAEALELPPNFKTASETASTVPEA